MIDLKNQKPDYEGTINKKVPFTIFLLNTGLHQSAILSHKEQLYPCNLKTEVGKEIRIDAMDKHGGKFCTLVFPLGTSKGDFEMGEEINGTIDFDSTNAFDATLVKYEKSFAKI